MFINRNYKYISNFKSQIWITQTMNKDLDLAKHAEDQFGFAGSKSQAQDMVQNISGSGEQVEPMNLSQTSQNAANTSVAGASK